MNLETPIPVFASEMVEIRGKQFKAIRGQLTVAKNWNGKEIAILATSDADLAAAFEALHPGQTFNAELSQEVLILGAQNVDKLNVWPYRGFEGPGETLAPRPFQKPKRGRPVSSGR